MQIRLQTLDHQQRALTAINRVFQGIELNYDGLLEANPSFDVADPQLRHNISELQNGAVEGLAPIPRSWRTSVDDGILGIDVKMETGTGKTLVYTQMMFELNRLYGFNKFIVLVPSTAIKLGTRAFMESEYARKYFDDAYGRNIKLNLEVLDPQKRSKGRKLFPNAIANFVSASRLSKGYISTLLMTDGMLRSAATMGATYDQTVLGMSSQPYEALAATRPIVIIDEPHRFRRDNKAYETLIEQIQPLAVIRFGATFPKNDKTGKVDYNNLVFNLGAVEAFNEQLVKGVAVQYPDAEGQYSTRLKLTSLSASKPKQATFTDLDSGKSFPIGIGGTLAEADGAFAGITLEAVGKTENAAIKSGVTLSNGQILGKGDTLVAGVYSQTYQELMIARALDNHFETEWENFRRATKVKTLTLFFIDSIESYRGETGPGHLRMRFEELLSEKLKAVIAEHEGKSSQVAKDYVTYLKASLSEVSATNGGYFAADNSSTDEAIQAEVDLILRDKQTMLSFTKEDGSLNTMRFIFSKWTLREGWDNPNVFQIVKLRSSGSEISKLQEVGRGLRLPVDESGSRLADQDFRLTYLVDYTEEAFANNLVNEINADSGLQTPSVKELLPKVSAKLGLEETVLFIELLQKGLVDTDKNLVEGKAEELYELYPQFAEGKLKPGKVTTDSKKGTVGIRAHRYSELKELWEAVNAKYYLKLEDLTESELSDCIDEILNAGIYKAQFGRFTEDLVTQDDEGNLTTVASTKETFTVDSVIPYGQWLKLAYTQTYLPIAEIHAGLVRLNQKEKLRKDFFSKATLGEFVAQFHLWMQREFAKRFSYTRIDGPLGATALTDSEGEPLEKIAQGNVGVYRDTTHQVPEKFLYDAFIYDSPKEQSTIRDSAMDEIVVYGKIPRRSIQVPVYFGGTTSPDFMYVLKGEDGRMSLNFIVETKDVETSADLREVEQRRIASAKKFFESISDENINVRFAPQLKRDDIVTMIKQVVVQ